MDEIPIKIPIKSVHLIGICVFRKIHREKILALLTPDVEIQLGHLV